METDTKAVEPAPKQIQCYFDITISSISIGRIVFQLWPDQAPKTCENFRCLCTGEKGLSASGHELCYKGSLLHRVIKGFIVQGGDFTKRNGTGGESIYGGRFDDENLTHKHSKRGLLSMANAGKNTNGSQFFITFAPAPHLDGHNVVFGEVVSGFSALRIIEASKVIDEKTFKPDLDIIIEACGELSQDNFVEKEQDTTPEALLDNKKRKRHADDYSSDDSRSDIEDLDSRRRDSRKGRSPTGSPDRKRRKHLDSDDEIHVSHDRRRRSNGDDDFHHVRDDRSTRRPSREKEDNEQMEPIPSGPRVDSKGRTVKGRGTLGRGSQCAVINEREKRMIEEKEVSEERRDSAHRRYVLEKEPDWKRSREASLRMKEEKERRKYESSKEAGGYEFSDGRHLKSRLDDRRDRHNRPDRGVRERHASTNRDDFRRSTTSARQANEEHRSRYERKEHLRAAETKPSAKEEHSDDEYRKEFSSSTEFPSNHSTSDTLQSETSKSITSAAKAPPPPMPARRIVSYQGIVDPKSISLTSTLPAPEGLESGGKESNRRSDKDIESPRASPKHRRRADSVSASSDSERD